MDQDLLTLPTSTALQPSCPPARNLPPSTHQSKLPPALPLHLAARSPCPSLLLLRTLASPTIARPSFSIDISPIAAPVVPKSFVPIRFDDIVRVDRRLGPPVIHLVVLTKNILLRVNPAPPLERTRSTRWAPSSRDPCPP